MSNRFVRLQYRFRKLLSLIGCGDVTEIGALLFRLFGNSVACCAVGFFEQTLAMGSITVCEGELF